jgi:hypothetical protein
MALLIFPVAFLLGWFVRPPRRAEITTYAVGFGAFVVVSLLWAFSSGRLDVSPFNGVVLFLGTPVAGPLASWVARRRPSHRHPETLGAG